MTSGRATRTTAASGSRRSSGGGSFCPRRATPTCRAPSTTLTPARPPRPAALARPRLRLRPGGAAPTARPRRPSRRPSGRTRRQAGAPASSPHLQRPKRPQGSLERGEVAFKGPNENLKLKLARSPATEANEGQGVKGGGCGPVTPSLCCRLGRGGGRTRPRRARRPRRAPGVRSGRSATAARDPARRHPKGPPRPPVSCPNRNTVSSGLKRDKL